ncbi:MAG: hypothetical protein ACRDFS_10525 [Chloroflexota bacterium]
MRPFLSFAVSRALVACIVALLFLSYLPSRLTLAGTVAPLPPVSNAGGSLGMDDVLAGGPAGGQETWARLAYDAGARINRWEFRWDRIERERGAWSFVNDDPPVKASLTAGLHVEGILIGTPGWAAAPGQKPGNGVPGGLLKSINDPHNLWADYVRRTAAHYKGEVSFWEVWNEPDLPFFWSGTPAQYFRLLKVAYLVVHQTDPAAKVLMAGMVSPDLAFVSKVLHDAALDRQSGANDGYFDIFAWHAYGDDTKLYDNLANVRGLLTNDGFAGKPIWVTEDGFPASNPNGEQRQAAYVLQTIGYALAAGVQKVLVYRASDDTTHKEWGLLNAAGQPRLGYVAYQLAAQYLSRATAIVYAPTPNLQRLVFYSPGKRTTVFWTNGVSGRSAVLDASGKSISVVHVDGSQTSVPASRGAAHIPIAGASFNLGIDPKGAVVGSFPVIISQDNPVLAGALNQSFIPSVLGDHRHLLIVNPSAAKARVQVSALAEPDERVNLPLPPQSVRSIDLDLLAGPAYGGLYSVSSGAGVAIEAVSDRVSVNEMAPASRWLLTSVHPGISLHATNVPATVRISGYTSKGKRQGTSTVKLNPSQRLDWVPHWGHQTLSLDVQANAPIMVSSIPAGISAASQASTSWFALHALQSRLNVFNPGSKTTSVSVNYVGAEAAVGEQLKLRAHRTVSVPTHRAKAVAIAADQPIVAGYGMEKRGVPDPVTSPTTNQAFAIGGRDSHISLYDPAKQVAHVTLSLAGKGTGSRAITVGPGQAKRLFVRNPARGPRGAVISSDVPVAAAPSD